MINTLLRFLRNTDATAAVEAAIFAPIFLLMTAGITDLGSGMFLKMQADAAAQGGAAYAVSAINKGTDCVTTATPPVPSATGGCITNIKTAMDHASGNFSFCSAAPACSPTIGNCPSDANTAHYCIIVSASFSFATILPDGVYSWAPITKTYPAIVTARVK